MSIVTAFRDKILKFLSHPVFAGSFIMVFGSNAVNFLNYLYHLIMGRLLGPVGYGELAAIFSLIGLLGIIPSSLSLAIIKFVSSSSTDKETAVIVNWFNKKIILISLFLAILILITTPLIASFLKINNYFAVAIIGAVFLFTLPALIYRSTLQGLLKFRQMVISILAENSIKLILGALFVYLGLSVSGAMGALLIAGFVGWWLSRNAIRSYFNLNVKDQPHLKSLFLYSIPVMVQSIAMNSLFSMDLILVKHFFSSQEAGIYAAISTLGKIIFFGAGPIGAVMFPLIAKRKNKGESYQKVFLYSLLLTLLLALIVSAVYWIFPQMSLKFLYGSLYLEGANLLGPFGVFITLFTLASLFIYYNLSMGKTKVVVLPTVAALTQLGLIWYFHSNLMSVIVISIIVNALLLGFLLIYSSYGKRIFRGDKITVGHSPSL